ncbi:MAG TPA: chemotaxis protein CheW [Thermoanaerobaculia bacterium]|nr:chemotaxis protein CheW [Thermoanaerobaculia bacterium]
MTEDLKRVILRFRVGMSAYAAPIEVVQEVVQQEEFTRVPSMPAAIYGLMNLRGNVVPVIDLMRRFDLDKSAMAMETWAIVFQMEGDERSSLMAVLSSSSAEVLTIAAGDIYPAPTFGVDIAVEYLAGMIHLGDELVLLLNVDRVLSAEDLLRTREGLARQNHVAAECVDVAVQR